MEAKLTLTITEAAHELSLSKSQTYELARSGQIPGVIRLGEKRIVVSTAILTAWINGQQQYVKQYPQPDEQPKGALRQHG